MLDDDGYVTEGTGDNFIINAVITVIITKGHICFKYVNFHSLFWKKKGKKLSAINYSPKTSKPSKYVRLSY